MSLTLQVLNNNISSGGVILYEGPSQLDHSPIVCIATLKTANTKTGPMIQTWIMRSDVNPVEAVKTNQDSSICGSCRHRGTGEGKNRSCYVNIGQAPLNIYRTYKRGKYKSSTDLNWLIGRYLRMGSYGEPTAVPYGIWDELAKNSNGYTGYTHTWRTCDDMFKNILMASVDSREEYLSARAAGWRTFRTFIDDDLLYEKEFICPASEDAGYRLTCAECKACSGTKWDKLAKAATVAIRAHGSPSKIHAYKKVTEVDRLTEILL